MRYKTRKNYPLVKKYRRYLKLVRNHSLCNTEKLIIPNNQTSTIACRNRMSANRNTIDLFESPWVKSEQAADNSSRSSRKTYSSISSLRNRIAPRISPKARDVADIIADLYVVPEDIIIGSLILEGTFGRLYQAKLHIPADRRRPKVDRWIDVFVKTVSEHATEEQIKNLLRDAAKFAGLQNKQLANIVASSKAQMFNMTGFDCVTSMPLLIYPHADHGNLKHFLRKTPTGYSNNQNVIVLTIERVVEMALQILRAVEYLHKLNIIHGDVATRNCLLDIRLRVSLGDSALSRDFFPEDYHCLGDNKNRPIKWLALEALVERKFSTATDVWSIGVTMWELITKGQQPYEMFDPFEMTNILCAGYRLQQPLNCPDHLWNIIHACWKMPPSSRPSISELKQDLENFRETINNYI